MNDNSGLKAIESIREKEDVIAENYKIMQLYSPSLSYVSKEKINYAIENFEPLFNKTEVMKRMHLDGFGEWNTSDLFSTFKRFTHFS